MRLDYECLRSLPGGMQEVRVWRDKLTGGQRVGKRVDLLGAGDGGVLLEPEVLEQVRHDNVVPLFTAALVDGFPSPMRVVEIVMPFYPRGSVTDALLRGERFSVSESLARVQAALRGLGELHERHGVLHRDVKSSNLLLTDDVHLLLVSDLGLAGRMDASGACPALGNPQLYSPPELVATGVWTRASDLFSLGLVLRELLAGPFPYGEYTTTEVSDRLMRGVSPLRGADLALPVWTPKDLRAVVRRATANDPRQRYARARDMGAALARARVADWVEVAPDRWEAPCRRPGRRVAVRAVSARGGRVRLSLLGYRTAWQRVSADVTVDALRSAAAAAVFDQATALACVR